MTSLSYFFFAAFRTLKPHTPTHSSHHHARIRTNSTSSAISLDQGYISSSPCTGGGVGGGTAGEFAAMFSPSSSAAQNLNNSWSSAHQNHRFTPVILQRSSGQPSTSPLPELPDRNGDDDNLTMKQQQQQGAYGSPHLYSPSSGSGQFIVFYAFFCVMKLVV